jgi:hypothetical protein
MLRERIFLDVQADPALQPIPIVDRGSYIQARTADLTYNSFDELKLIRRGCQIFSPQGDQTS